MKHGHGIFTASLVGIADRMNTISCDEGLQHRMQSLSEVL